MNKTGWIGIAMVLLLLAGCASPKVSQHGRVAPDQDVIEGGLSSGDIRTMAEKMGPQILSIPEIANTDGVTRIAISPMKNSSRFIIDMNIFMKKLRLELSRYSGGKLRFYSQNNATGTRNTILKNRQEEQISKVLDGLAEQIVNLPVVQNSTTPIKMAILPVLNVNFVQMNADSFAAMLRSKIVDRANGKVLFLMPGAEKGADYYLTGQFIADSMKQEGIVNLPAYINLLDERIKNGESLDLYEDSPAGVGSNNSGNQLNIVNGDWHRRYPSLFNQLQLSAELRKIPNVTKRLNVMLVRSNENVAVWEKMVTLEKKITDGTENSDYILSGEISGLSKSNGRKQSDYLLMTMQLVNPVSNEVLWEDGYEVKKSSTIGTVYQ